MLTTDVHAEALARWDRRVTPTIIAAALLPLGGALVSITLDTVSAVVLIACWLVFFVDLVVHVRLRPGYLRTRSGVIDLAIVVMTFPWELVVPSFDQAGLLMLARFARVARVAVAASRGVPGMRQLVDRLGRAALYAAIVTVAAASATCTRAESSNPEFPSFGDSLWWAVVTVTTVGYGDMVPVSIVGRVTAGILMIAGLTLLGTLAGTLASSLGIADAAADTASASADAHRAAATDGDCDVAGGKGVQEELVALRNEVTALRDAVNRMVPPDDLAG